MITSNPSSKTVFASNTYVQTYPTKSFSSKMLHWHNQSPQTDLVRFEPTNSPNLILPNPAVSVPRDNLMMIPRNFFYERFIQPQQGDLFSPQLTMSVLAQRASMLLITLLPSYDPTVMYSHLGNMISFFKLDEELFLTSLIILHRYMRIAGPVLSITQDSELFYLMILCILISCKALHDDQIKSGNIARVLNLEPARIYHNEIQILTALNFTLFFSEEDIMPLTSIFPREGFLCLSFSRDRKADDQTIQSYCESCKDILLSSPLSPLVSYYPPENAMTPPRISPSSPSDDHPQFRNPSPPQFSSLVTETSPLSGQVELNHTPPTPNYTTSPGCMDEENISNDDYLEEAECEDEKSDSSEGQNLEDEKSDYVSQSLIDDSSERGSCLFLRKEDCGSSQSSQKSGNFCDIPSYNLHCDESGSCAPGDLSAFGADSMHESMDDQGSSSSIDGSDIFNEESPLPLEQVLTEDDDEVGKEVAYSCIPSSSGCMTLSPTSHLSNSSNSPSTFTNCFITYSPCHTSHSSQDSLREYSSYNSSHLTRKQYNFRTRIKLPN